MEFKEALERRVSCRKYENRPVPRELLEQCVDAGRRAPSGCNLQQWGFIAVDDPGVIGAVSDAMRDDDMRINTFVSKIPALIVIVKKPIDLSPTHQRILADCGSQSQVLNIDIGCAAMQICLAAADLGLGSIIMAKINQPMARAALCLPDELEVTVVLGIGYPASPQSNPTSRKALGEVLCWNAYRQ